MDFFDGAGEDFVVDVGWDYADTIDIAEENVTGSNRDPADFDWNSKIVDFVSWPAVLAIGSKSEGGKVHALQATGVTIVSIEDGSTRAEESCPSCHHLAPVCVTRGCTSADIDFVGAKIIQCLEHEPEWLLHEAV